MLRKANGDESADNGATSDAIEIGFTWLAAVSIAEPESVAGLQQECDVCILPPQLPAICAQHFISEGVSARCGSRQASAGSTPQRTRRSTTAKMRTARITSV